MPTKRSPGAMLRAALKAKGYSQAQLAKEMGISKQTVNSFLKERRPILPLTAIKIQMALGENFLSAEALYLEQCAKNFEEQKEAFLDEFYHETP